MNLELVTAPTEMPLTLDQAKAHLRVDGSDEDALITALIQAATDHVQNITNRQLMRATYRLTLDRLSSTVPLPRPPFAAITSIQAIDENGQEVAFTGTYYTTIGTNPATVRGVSDSGWYASTYRDIAIEYETGYETAAEIPEVIILALKALITFFYENRGDANKEIPQFIFALLGSYRVFSF